MQIGAALMRHMRIDIALLDKLLYTLGKACPAMPAPCTQRCSMSRAKQQLCLSRQIQVKHVQVSRTTESGLSVTTANAK